MNNIEFDERNYRLHDDKNKELIKSSLKDLGTGRSILLDKENVIVAGNGVYEQAQELGLRVRVIESDGTELIAKKERIFPQVMRRESFWPWLTIRPRIPQSLICCQRILSFQSWRIWDLMKWILTLEKQTCFLTCRRTTSRIPSKRIQTPLISF